jgi:hypothetical protein
MGHQRTYCCSLLLLSFLQNVFSGRIAVGHTLDLLIPQEAYKHLRLWKMKSFIQFPSNLIVSYLSVFLAQAYLSWQWPLPGTMCSHFCFQSSRCGQARGPMIGSCLALKLETCRMRCHALGALGRWNFCIAGYLRRILSNIGNGSQEAKYFRCSFFQSSLHCLRRNWRSCGKEGVDAFNRCSRDHRPRGKQIISECVLSHESKYSDIFSE